MEDYTDVTCDVAVTNIKQKLREWKKRAYANLSKNYCYEIVTAFLDEHDTLMQAVNKRSTVENLKNLELFLSEEEVRERWYRPEYRD